MGDVRGDHRLADGLHGLFEQLPVLCLGNGLRTGPQQADPLPLQKALLGKLHGKGQPRLPAEGGQKAVRLLFFDNALHRGDGERL
ncbi:hypothetical protein SDC9_152371 [bioreactor metagenome]|uniref:Uncharacterized protein n=1 Tax=bioreactor metagenome TaxID=1076179 RepID=A0A645ESW3_9ZZZZ